MPQNRIILFLVGTMFLVMPVGSSLSAPEIFVSGKKYESLAAYKAERKRLEIEAGLEAATAKANEDVDVSVGTKETIDEEGLSEAVLLEDAASKALDEFTKKRKPKEIFIKKGVRTDDPLAKMEPQKGRDLLQMQELLSEFYENNENLKDEAIQIDPEKVKTLIIGPSGSK